MRRGWLFVTISLMWMFFVPGGQGAISRTERHEIRQRLRDFYRVPWDPKVMNRPVPKYDIAKGIVIDDNTVLKAKVSDNPSPLAKSAQGKLSASYFDALCSERNLSHFPGLHCGQSAKWEAWQPNDLPGTLASGWMAPGDFVSAMDKLPISGTAAVTPWSDSYWPFAKGMASYRYASGINFPNYLAAIGAYQQPADWLSLSPSPAERRDAAIASWSPTEKYDLSVGDSDFTLTAFEKEVGKAYEDANGNVPNWMGVCQGWSAAAIMAAKPKLEVSVDGLGGSHVLFYPDDIKAILSVSWGTANVKANFIGTRCQSTNPMTYENGRLADPSCFDSNPATFHLALANMIGRAHQPFIMDAAYDYQIWNQPIYGYEFTYFNPEDPDRQSKSWRDVAVPYDDFFRSGDRFQSPLTRGVRLANGQFDDSGIRYLVGVIASVDYMAEVNPSHSPHPDQMRRVNYTYDLEIYAYQNEWTAQGGEWQENAHPDFLWIPEKSAVASASEDSASLSYDGKQSADVASAAKAAAKKGQVLCHVVKYLVAASTGKDYRCE